MKLYHGTSERHVAAILRDGIKPRGKGKGNWKHTIESNAESVYLTSTYGIYFAGNVTKTDERLAVIEIDTDKLAMFALFPDEDFLEQATRKEGPAPIDKPMKYRTRWYRRRAWQYASYWKHSVDGMGTCCYNGTIPVTAITRIAYLDHKTYSKLIFMGMDPTITILNYQICETKYRNYIAWLFGDALTSAYTTEQLDAMDESLRMWMTREREVLTHLDRSQVEVVDMRELVHSD